MQKSTNTGRYWYEIFRAECVLCGKRDDYKERRAPPKPADPEQRQHFRQFACMEHFV